MFFEKLLSSFRGAILALVLAFSFSQAVVAPAPAYAQQQTVTLQTICGNINATWPDIAQVYAQILALINNGLQQLLQVGVGVGVGNIQACLPNINIQLPNIDLSGCFNLNLQASCNFNVQLPNLQGCLNNSLGQLQAFLQSLNINIDMNALLQCLSGLVNINITIPDLLATLQGIFDSILGLLNSLTASINWYSDVFQFFVGFCQGYNSSGGFSAGFGCGGGAGGSTNGGGNGGGSGGGYTFNNGASVSNNQLNINLSTVGGTAPLLGNGPATAAQSSLMFNVIADIQGVKSGKSLKKFSVPCYADEGVCRKKYSPNPAMLKKLKGKALKLVITVYPEGGNATNSLPLAELYNSIRF